MSNWTKFVTSHFNQQRKKNPSYKFGQAMKDAGKLYKKGAKTINKTFSIGKGGKKNGTRKMRK